MNLEERLESGNAEAWRPDKEDADLLVGEIVDIDRGQSDYEPYPILTVRKEDGSEVAVHAFHTVLKNELIRQQPNIGERIGIKYLGEQKTKPGSKFSSFIGYRVKVDREAKAFNWGTMGAEPDPTVDAYDPAPDGLTAAAAPAAAAAPGGTVDDDSIPFGASLL